MDKIIYIIMVPFSREPNSGGHRTVLKRVNKLMESNISIVMMICSGDGLYKIDINGIELNKFIRENYKSIDNYNEIRNMSKLKIITNSNDNIKKLKNSIVIGTGWQTWDILNRCEAQKKFLFMQDREELFDATINNNLLQKIIKETYLNKNIITITLSKYLFFYKLNKYNGKTYINNFGINKDIYYDKKINKEFDICFYYMTYNKRKPELLIKIINSIYKINPNIKSIIFGHKPNLNIPNCFEVGLKTLDELSEIYNKCKVGICLSSTNPSRIPFEMKNCNLIVFELNNEFTAHDLPDEYFYKINEKDINKSILKIIHIINDIAYYKYCLRKISKFNILSDDDEINEFYNIIINNI